jgi:hypothetical protein
MSRIWLRRCGSRSPEGLEHRFQFAWRIGDDAKHLVGRSLSLRGFAQLALRHYESAFEIASGFLRHRGRPVPSRLDAKELKFYATLGNPSMA